MRGGELKLGWTRDAMAGEGSAKGSVWPGLTDVSENCGHREATSCTPTERETKWWKRCLEGAWYAEEYLS